MFLRFVLFTMPSLVVPPAQPGQLRNTAKRQSWTIHWANNHTFFGGARTQAPTTRNYTLELPTSGVIARVNPIEVQWKGLVLRGLPPWSQYLPLQVSFCILGGQLSSPKGCAMLAFREASPSSGWSAKPTSWSAQCREHLLNVASAPT